MFIRQRFASTSLPTHINDGSRTSDDTVGGVGRHKQKMNNNSSKLIIISIVVMIGCCWLYCISVGNSINDSIIVSSVKVSKQQQPNRQIKEVQNGLETRNKYSVFAV